MILDGEGSTVVDDVIIAPAVAPVAEAAGEEDHVHGDHVHGDHVHGDHVHGDHVRDGARSGEDEAEA